MLTPGDFHGDQADALCDDLSRRIAALDAKTVRLKAQMAKYLAEKRPAQISRLQSQSRAAALERRELITMLVNLGHNYPCDHPQVTPTPSEVQDP